MSARAGSIVVLHIGRFIATATIPPIEPGKTVYMPVEWEPVVPRFDVDLSPAELAEYRRRIAEAVAPREVLR